jgi:AcrR family transcriptional regulator
VPFGSLYQYFPDKTAIIGTLAERYKLIMTLIAATVRHAITQDAARILTLFKRMLPKNLAVLEM